MERIGTAKFDKGEDSDGIMVLRPASKLFHFGAFVSEQVEPLVRYSYRNPFFVIRGVGVDSGRLVGKGGDGVNDHFHFDEGRVVVLSNNHDSNGRGSTDWITNYILTGSIKKELKALKAFASSGHYHEPLASAFCQRIDDLQTRDDYNVLLGVCYAKRPLPDELKAIFDRIETAIAAELRRCDWAKHPHSVLVFNNEEGFHRGNYNEEEGKALVRHLVH